MDKSYEYIHFENNFPIKAFVHRISSFKLHWHNQIEILYVVKGSINVTVNAKTFTLYKDDMIFINQAEVHSTNHTEDDNIIIAIQIMDSEQGYFYNLKKLSFDSEAFFRDNLKNKLPKKELHSYIVQIIWEYTKKAPGFENVIISLVNSIIACLVRNYYLTSQTEKSMIAESDLKRLTNILNYLKNHYSEKISLQEIAEIEHINYYYLSHFFKSTAGISFQEYLKNYRLDKSLKQLTDSDKSVTDIAAECGFPNIKAYSNAFKEKFDMLPSEYRKKFNSISQNTELSEVQDIRIGSENELYYNSLNNKEDLSIIFKDMPGETITKPSKSVGAERKEIIVDSKCSREPLEKYWNTLTTFGRASECLREDLRNQLRELKSCIDFKYIRFHGIFNDEMMVVNQRDNGEIVYNWSYVDSVLDFILSIGIKPFIELGFMPPAFASSYKSIFWWKGNVSQPKDINLWTDLVKALIIHCINRYGEEEVSSWYLEVWNEPDYIDVFWEGTKEDYFRFYKHTAEAARSIFPNIKIGGPALTHIQYKDNPWIRDFSQFCVSNNVPLDFISFHIYSDESNLYLKNENGIFPTIPKRAFHSQDKVKEIIEHYTGTAKGIISSEIEFHVTEWNISPKPRFLIRDTAFMAPYILKNILSNLNSIASLGFWTSSDILEELRAPISPFHGGLGMINVHGIKKPSFHAFHLLSKLGNIILEQGDDFIVTKQNNNYQILCFNFNKFDSLAANGDFSMEDDKNRYNTFEKKPTKNFSFTLQNINGSFKETRFELNRDNGSAFDEWLKIGMPSNLTQEEVSYLKCKSIPTISTKSITANSSHTFDIDVPEFGCALITLTWEV